VVRFRKLILEVSGRCDREAMRAVIWRAVGVDASEVRFDFGDAADVDGKALRLLAAVIRRRGSGRVIRVHGLPARHADALNRLGVPVGVVVGVRPSQ
jgi:ABC-type transporter Mla MlaB component